jgi:uncharacterized membrane protein YbhN (UPF0104 family)
MEENPLAGLNGRTVAFRLGILVLLVAVAGFFIVGLVPEAGKHLAQASAGWIALGVALELAACAAYAWLFDVVFSYGEYRSTPVRSSQIALGELGAFAVVPTGIGGPVLRFWALMRGGMPFRVVIVRSVVQAPILNSPYILAAMVLGIGVATGVGPGNAPLAVALAPLGVVAAAVALAGAATWYVRTRRNQPRSELRGRAREVVQAIPDGLREVPGRLRRPGSLLGAGGYWAGDCGVLVVAFQAAGGSAPIGVIILAYMLGQLGNALPLPGGVGGVEPLILGVLTASGVDAGLGAAAVVLYRLVSLGIQAILGTAAVVTLVPALRRSS